ncbi:CbtA family protein, partial [Saccharomonospora iraqiensis]|uniref:CbtA family protein n=1 Tax=Saccharomonospora iraqiensis TaxID=52698 RepID=UPI0009FFCD08
MMRTLLVRGMLAGLIAGVLAAVFAYTVGEPHVDAAIALEESGGPAGHTHSGDHGTGHADAAGDSGHAHGEAAPVSRGVQSTIGLVTGTGAYGVAVGGLFAIVFALVQGRISTLRPRVSAALLAAGAFVVVVAVPFVKYPANPPAVGQPGTIGDRTSLYFGLAALSLAFAVIAVVAGWVLADRVGAWYGGMLAAAGYLAAVTAIAALFPAPDEVPARFPASLLWEFRLGSLGVQLVLWTALGLAFGTLAERALRPATPGGAGDPAGPADTPVAVGQ